MHISPRNVKIAHKIVQYVQAVIAALLVKMELFFIKVNVFQTVQLEPI